MIKRALVDMSKGELCELVMKLRGEIEQSEAELEKANKFLKVDEKAYSKLEETCDRLKEFIEKIVNADPVWQDEWGGIVKSIDEKFF